MTNLDSRPAVDVLDPVAPCAAAVEVLEPRPVPLGGVRSLTVYRTLPQRRRSLVGSWCFLDHYGPDDVAVTGGMRMPRHPHTGLATVSWLFSGHVEHLDSGGTAATVVPGELNLMIAGRGITHQEISGADAPALHGVQLWYALPDAVRFGDNAFVHHVPEPLALPGATVRVFLGELLGSVSPVDTRTPGLLGAELVLDAGASLQVPVRTDFEHAVLAENSDVTVGTTTVGHRCLGYVPPGTGTIGITAGGTPARVLLLGGIPWDGQIVMWWNFVGRDHDEIQEFRRRYQAELGFEPADPRDAGTPALFGEFPPGLPSALPAPPLPTSRLVPREQ
jgi:redox-sensitive bicupin YhaK (pirin superfamily)